jgi:hypothetical protein
LFDVFTEETEMLVKRGISNLYWYKSDLKKAWLRSNVSPQTCEQLFARRTIEGKKLTKRELMDLLYLEIRKMEYNRRLEISRNFVRILIEHTDFVPQDKGHRIEDAETCALKLKEIYRKQESEKEAKELNIARRHTNLSGKISVPSNIDLALCNDKFIKALNMQPQARGYELERIFPELMRIYGVPVQEPFKITGEQIDGAIKYDGHYYLVELKWVDRFVAQADVSSLYLKIEGKFESRGIFIAMNGYSPELQQSIYRGKELKAIFWTGQHLANLFSGMYTFQELMNYALSEASVKGNIFCDSQFSK